VGFYCFKDKSGHCQSKHATYHETSGGSYDGDSGGGDGSSSPGETVGALIFLAVIAGVIYWVFASLNDWMDSNHSTEQQASFASASYADSSDRARSEPTDRFNGHYVSREEANRYQLELERKKAQSSSLRLRELDAQYASEELEFDREIERVKKETASLLPKLDEQYAAKVREFKEALRLNDFELAKRKDAESLQLLDKRNALEVEGATRVNEILKQKLAAIKAAIERIRAD
jgi:hypothetical protein